MDAPLTDDGGLMLAWAGGDSAAFGELYAKHKGPLYRFPLKTVKDRTVADELFQETWSRVIVARQRYRAEAKFSTWLLQIAHNLAVDSFRRQRPRAGAEEAEAVFAAQAAPEREQPDHALSISNCAGACNARSKAFPTNNERPSCYAWRTNYPWRTSPP